MGKLSALRAPAATDADIVWMSPADVCKMLPSMTEDILSARRKRREDPPFYKPTGQSGAVVLYDQAEVIAWVRSSKVATRPATAVAS